jgi:hypothetical protein
MEFIYHEQHEIHDHPKEVKTEIPEIQHKLLYAIILPKAYVQILDLNLDF